MPPDYISSVADIWIEWRAKGVTLEMCGKPWGVTRERVRQVVAKREQQLLAYQATKTIPPYAGETK